VHGTGIVGIGLSLLGIYWVSRPAKVRSSAAGITSVVVGLMAMGCVGLSEILP
jgi:drug/metabolite transporter (DMT)-like permease